MLQSLADQPSSLKTTNAWMFRALSAQSRDFVPRSTTAADPQGVMAVPDVISQRWFKD